MKQNIVLFVFLKFAYCVPLLGLEIQLIDRVIYLAAYMGAWVQSTK